MKVLIIYYCDEKNTKLYLEGRQTPLSGFEFLNDKSIPEWFVPYSSINLMWNGLVKELELCLNNFIYEIKIEFIGDEYNKNLFDYELNKYSNFYYPNSIQSIQNTDYIHYNYKELAENEMNANNYDQAMSLYLQAYNHGDIEAGIKYLEFLNIEDSINTYIALANDSNSLSAIMELCLIYSKGRGCVKKDLALLQVWTSKLEKYSTVQTDKFLGEIYLTVFYGIDNIEDGISYLKKSVKKGNAEAQFQMGGCYISGLGVARDLYNASKHLEQAVQGNHVDAMYVLGNLLAYQKSDEDSYIDLYIRAADLGSLDAMNALGEYYINKGECQIGVKYYKEASKRNSADASFNLGMYYQKSNNEQEKDLVWENIGLSIEQGSAAAMVYAGETILKEDTSETSLKEAIIYFEKAAILEDINGILALARCYEQGVGVEKDINKSIYYTLMAAIRKDISALRQVALITINAQESERINFGLHILDILCKCDDTYSMFINAEYHEKIRTAENRLSDTLGFTDTDREECTVKECIAKEFECYHNASIHGEWYGTICLMYYLVKGYPGVVDVEYNRALESINAFKEVMYNEEIYSVYDKLLFAQKLYDISDVIFEDMTGFGMSYISSGENFVDGLFDGRTDPFNTACKIVTNGFDLFFGEEESAQEINVKKTLYMECMEISKYLGDEEANKVLNSAGVQLLLG